MLLQLATRDPRGPVREFVLQPYLSDILPSRRGCGRSIRPLLRAQHHRPRVERKDRVTLEERIFKHPPGTLSLSHQEELRDLARRRSANRPRGTVARPGTMRRNNESRSHRRFHGISTTYQGAIRPTGRVPTLEHYGAKDSLAELESGGLRQCLRATSVRKNSRKKAALLGGELIDVLPA